MNLTKEQLKELLKEHLSIEINEEEDMYSKELVISIHFDNEEISSSRHTILRKPY